MPTLGAALDFSKYEARNMRGHQLGSAPASPVTGQLYYNTGDNTLYWWDGTVWQSAKGGAPGGPAGGDLSGTYPNPQIATGVIVDTDVAAANKDGTAATPSLRTLGTGAQQAAAGNDSRLSDARTPTAHKTTHEPGGSDPLTVDAVVGTGSLRTLGSGAQQAMPGNRTLDAITAPAADVSLNSHKITNLLDPTANQDAATKIYVDGLISGLSWKKACRVASTTNIGASPPGGPQTVDGVAVANNDRVLLTAQTVPADNGIWIANTSGTWVRATDADTSAELVNAAVFISEGTANADTAWVCSTNAPITVGTTTLTWVQFNGAAQIVGGAGLTKTGNTLDVGAGSGISVAADTVGIAAGGVTFAMMAAGSVDLQTSEVVNYLPFSKGGWGIDMTSAVNRQTQRSGLDVAGYYSTATHGAGTTITILASAHFLRGSRGILVQVQDAATGAVEIPDIVVAANGDVTITYGASVAANSKRITLVG